MKFEMKQINVYRKHIEGLTADLQVLTDAITARPIGTTITNGGDDRDKFVKSNVIYTALTTKQDEIRDETNKRLPKHIDGLTDDLQVLTDAITARPIGTEITDSGPER